MAGVYARRLDLVVVVLLWLALMTGCGRPSAPALTSFMVPAGDSVQVGATPALAFSRTGELLVYVGQRSNRTELYLQAVSGGPPRALVGTEGAPNPFFSPDGRWLGFFADGKLKKLLLEDRNAAPIVICDAVGPRGASWGDDGRIVFAIIRTTASSDGPPTVVFEGPYAAGDAGGPNYDVAPDGKTFIMVRSEVEPEQLEIRVVPDWAQYLPK